MMGDRQWPTGAELQTDLLGEPTDPRDLELGPVQRLVLRELRRHGTLTTDEAGQVVHHHRGKHDLDAVCAFCGVDGREVLAALVRRRLAERGPGGVTRVARPERETGAYDPATAEIPF